jgi:hypothetical protein
VLSLDEKRQVQAPDRAQPLLPMTPGGGPERRDARLRAARHHLAVRRVGRGDRAGGRAVPPAAPRQQEFLRFLDHLDRSVARELGTAVRLVPDRYATHETPAVKRWFVRHPDYHLHFTPTGSAWLNRVERFFAEITERRIRRGTSASVPALGRAIEEYLLEHNKDPRPFAWVADADSILDRVKKVCERTSDSGH